MVPRWPSPIMFSELITLSPSTGHQERWVPKTRCAAEQTGQESLRRNAPGQGTRASDYC